MSSSKAIIVLAVLLVLQFNAVRSNFLSPLFPPIVDDMCKKVDCGKGTCKPSNKSALFYECECEPGWKQTRPEHDDDFKFLPCVVPNCTMNYSCNEAPAPVQDKASKANASIFDPCHWTDCGGGSCNKTSRFTYNCECAMGYYNLLNVSAFPCLRECAIGMDCSSLGISVSNKSTSPTAALADNGNQASSILKGNFYWSIVLLMSMAMQWK